MRATVVASRLNLIALTFVLHRLQPHLAIPVDDATWINEWIHDRYGTCAIRLYTRLGFVQRDSHLYRYQPTHP
ncbi:MAG TPA: hypothetical protein VGD71_05880 [Kribbella sp.]|jgi:hypothetical protein